MLIFKYVIVVPVRSGSYLRYFDQSPLSPKTTLAAGLL